MSGTVGEYEEHTYESADELPEGVPDTTAGPYHGPLLHGKCPECGFETAITIWRDDEPTWCPENANPNSKTGHLVEWEVIERDE